MSGARLLIGGLAVALYCAPSMARDIHFGAVTDAALLTCDQLQWRGQRESAQRCYRALLTSATPLSVQAEAAWALGDVKTANEAFNAAVKQQSSARLLTRWGELFAATHQQDEAGKLFQEALALDANEAYAKVAAAGVLIEQFAAPANAYLQAVLADANAAPGARVRALLLLARVQLENNDLQAAEALLNQAERAASQARLPLLPVYGLYAALELLQAPLGTDVVNSSWVKKALAINPAYGDAYAIPAHFYVITRRTREAAELYRLAVSVQPDHWQARVDYGSSLLRDNRLAEARTQMEAAYRGDPFNPVTVNTLRLLDSFKNYDTLTYPDLSSEQAARTSPKTPMVLRLHKKESAVLAPYVARLTEQAAQTYARKYQFNLAEPVVIEIYPNHEDFAVRTAGEPGLGLLGVTFGYVVAMDSPSSRSVDEFHWGSTLWHELAHVFTLEATEHRVPRWFSEGISVYEEWNSGPIAGISIPEHAYRTFKEGKHLPVAQLDRGFMHPESPQQVMDSYMQAGLICEFIARQFGADKLTAMLMQFRQGRSTAQAVQAALSISDTEFDTRFTAFLGREFKTLFDQFEVWQQARSTVAVSVTRSDWPRLIEAAKQALNVLPNDVDSGSPYVALARAYNATGNADDAQRTLETYVRYGGHQPDALRFLADRYRQQQRHAEAANVLSAINYVTPFDYDVHGQLGEVLMTLKRPTEALTEFQVAQKLNPPDKATAYFRIATALQALGRGAEAKRQVLLALEVAPSFRPAQQLLLELSK